MTDEKLSELRAMCAEYEQKKEACEAAGLKTKVADIAADGVGRRALEALPELVAWIRELEAQLGKQSLKQVSALEPCSIVSNNNSTPPEWLMHRFTEVK